MRSLFFCLFALLALNTEARAQEVHYPIIELRIARTAPTPGFATRRLADSTFYVSDTTLVSDSVIEDADTSSWQNGLVVYIHLKPEAASRVTAATSHHVGDRMAVFLAGEFKAAVVIRDALTGPKLQLELGPAERRSGLAAAISARWPAHH